MAERGLLLDAFNDCIDRMQRGASLDDCLRRYPDYAAELRSLLMTTDAVRRVQVPVSEAARAQMNARFRFEAALQDRVGRRRGAPAVLRYVAAVAAFVVVGGAVLTALSQSALPGDPLYGLKRTTEQALMALAGGGDDGRLNDRRMDEIRALLAAGRTQEVEFDGVIVAQIGSEWLVDDLPVLVTGETIGAGSARQGDRVRVLAVTTPGGQIIAHEIQMLEQRLTPEPTIAPTGLVLPATPPHTPTHTETPAPSETPSPTGTASATPTHTFTATPSNTPTPTFTPTRTASPSPTPTASRTRTPTATICAPAAPAGWVSYRVQAGDTLSGLAAATGAPLAQLLQVNCLTAQSILLAGQALLVPRVPPASAPTNAPPPLPTDDSGNSGPGSDDSGGDDSGDDSGSDDSGDDHSGSSGNSGSGGGDDDPDD